MQNIGLVMSVLASLLALPLGTGCKKDPSATGAAPSDSASTPAAAPLAPTAPAPAPSAAPLAGLDPCLVGNWKSTVFNLNNAQVTAEGGANTTLQIGAGGDAVVDFTGMKPVSGKGAGADFDFTYTGKATATVSTPARGAIASTKADMSALRVTANVSLPGAGKFPVLKNKSVSELAQMASTIAAGKAPSAAPPGVDSNPLFSTTRYTCEGNTLTLSGDGPSWTFTRAAH